MTCNHERCRFGLFAQIIIYGTIVWASYLEMKRNHRQDVRIIQQDARLDALESARDEEGK
jgi:hypothetical protein